MCELLNVYIFSTKNEVVKKRWCEMYGTKVISNFMLHKVSEKVFSKMPNAFSMIECSHLCILLYNCSRIKCCWPYLWGVIIQRNKGYLCFQKGMEKNLLDLCQGWSVQNKTYKQSLQNVITIESWKKTMRTFKVSPKCVVAFG
jgi:hypothetical protein